MSLRRPTLPHPPVLLLLFMLLLSMLLPPGGALSLVREGSPGLPDSDLDTSRFREMQKRYKDLADQLRVNQSREDSNPDPRTGPVVWILTPQVRPGPGGRLYLRIPRAALSAGRPAASRLHRALLWLSPTAPKPRDVTRPLRRLLARGDPAPPTLHLRLPPRLSDLALAAPQTARLELHLETRAARRRRSTRVPTAEACAAGAAHCCGVQSWRVTLDELGWTDWVLAPRELDVRACVGACPSRFRPASAHTRIKSRLHDLDPDSAPAPCCVPASFEPVAVMHLDSEGRVTLKTYDDILVKDCHCA
ncbi:PREDICTED: growth/differentiation factor 15-like [Elephantulus edwardii]|uniref:growth/differentiation factor 15-like n=1 Tax=Elephantulus edwardii TaxID=28737 RepID=UPI0003F05B89|nr:PREDICTED: growth/differentiation factor 15-like [Elephantulus edwardii]